MDNPAFPDRIRYHYRSDPATPLQVAHGVWGGVNPHGEIEICFYHESDIPPRTSEQSIGADGAPGPELAAGGDGSRHIARQIHTRILVNHNTAQALLEWLEERIAELDGEGSQGIYDLDSGIKQ